MPQTKEQRIYKHYQSKRHVGKNLRGAPSFGFDSNDDRLILWLARHWKMRCVEIKAIVRANQRQNKEAEHNE